MATSSAETDSSGQWEMPPGLRRKSMATGQRWEMMAASWPAPEGRLVGRMESCSSCERRISWNGVAMGTAFWWDSDYDVELVTPRLGGVGRDRFEKIVSAARWRSVSSSAAEVEGQLYSAGDDISSARVRRDQFSDGGDEGAWRASSRRGFFFFGDGFDGHDEFGGGGEGVVAAVHGDGAEGVADWPVMEIECLLLPGAWR